MRWKKQKSGKPVTNVAVCHSPSMLPIAAAAKTAKPMRTSSSVVLLQFEEFINLTLLNGIGNKGQTQERHDQADKRQVVALRLPEPALARKPRLRHHVRGVDVVQPARAQCQKEPRPEAEFPTAEEGVEHTELPCLPKQIVNAAGDDREQDVGGDAANRLVAWDGKG